MEWTDWDVRLSKILRSLWLFEEAALLKSMQQFAREIQANEKDGHGFYYGSINLQELLYFELPRRSAIPEESMDLESVSPPGALSDVAVDPAGAGGVAVAAATGVSGGTAGVGSSVAAAAGGGCGGGAAASPKAYTTHSGHWTVSSADAGAVLPAINYSSTGAVYGPNAIAIANATTTSN
jgi:hypothetical protein